MAVQPRSTPQRRAVLDVLSAAQDHPSAADIYQRVRSKLPGIGPATVYRTLALLVAGGQVRELDLGSASARYDANTARHDHVVCLGCEAAVDVSVPLPADTSVAVAARTGFEVTGYGLTFHGYCPACGAARKQSEDPGRTHGDTGR